jgi:hypothetical protein
MGRDRHAAYLVNLWAQMREEIGEDPAKVEEARSCALHMDLFRSLRLINQKKE